MSTPWQNDKPIYPKKSYKCGYCGKQRVCPYTYVDGVKSCQKCNREYNSTPSQMVAKCPTCSGHGYIEADMERPND